MLLPCAVPDLPNECWLLDSAVDGRVICGFLAYVGVTVGAVVLVAGWRPKDVRLTAGFATLLLTLMVEAVWDRLEGVVVLKMD